ncbi:sensor histidine kinase [Kitasatospora sp. NPDC058032]|uniref:sensor histidine kinase n=1 Tax=Kitasatospora sp. NPDC058032 TaxID=3346307 RepID=UPI0036DAF740
MNRQPHSRLGRFGTHRHLMALDVAGAALIGVPAVANAAWSAGRMGLPAWFGAVMVSGFAGAFAVRRRFPRAATAVAAVTFPAMDYSRFFPLAWLAMVLVVHRIPLRRPVRNAAGALAAVLAVEAVVGVLLQVNSGHVRFGPDLMAGALGVQLAAWTGGLLSDRRQAHQEWLREQAEQRAEAELARARRTVVEERLRIARELHDVVAHSMSIIAVQAGVGHHVIASRPDKAAEALAAIESTSRAALHELRSLLGVLRDGEPAEMVPGGLADLDVLVGQTRRAAVEVELTVVGELDGLPPGVDAAAYRIVQEALTNVVKHARTDRARLELRRTADQLSVLVRDEGCGCPAGTARDGHGLVGIRERAALYGGEAEAGPLPGGGFRVLVRLPIAGRRPVAVPAVVPVAVPAAGVVAAPSADERVAECVDEQAAVTL